MGISEMSMCVFERSIMYSTSEYNGILSYGGWRMSVSVSIETLVFLTNIFVFKVKNL